MTKKIMAALLALTTVMTAGCSKTAKDSVKETNSQLTKGRYVEEEIAADEIGTVTEFANGEKKQMADLSYDGTGDRIHHLEKDKFLSEKLEGFEGIGEHNMPADMAAAPDGRLFVSCMKEEPDEEGQLFRYGILSPDGEMKELKVDPEIMLVNSEFSKDGTLYATDGMALYKADPDSLELTKLCEFEDYFSRIDVVDDLIYLTDPDPSIDSIKIYDIAAGKLTDPDDALTGFWGKKATEDWQGSYDLFDGGDGALYIVCPDGIFRHMSGGSVVEQLVDGMTYSLSNSTDPIAYGTTDSDGSFIISFQNTDIMRYRYDPDAVNEFTSELDVYSLKESPALMQAVRTFSRSHPEVKVNLETGMKDGVTYEDAMKELTTRIMSDTAPDIIMLDGMDIGSLEQKGMLEDLSEMRDKWEPDNKLMKNITEWNSEGGLYSVAGRFGAVARAGAKSDFDKISSVNSALELILKADSEGKLSYTDTPMDEEQIAAKVKRDLLLSSDTLLKDGMPDKKALAEYYTNAQKAYSGNHLFNEKGMWDVAYLGIGYMNAVEGSFLNVQDIKTLSSINDGRDMLFGYGTGSGSLGFLPICNLGICSAGENKEAAAQLIKTALSSDVQGMSTEEGLPVDKKELEEVIGRDDMIGSLGLSGSDGSYVEYMLNCPSADEVTALTDYASSADTPLIVDDQTLDILTEAAVSCIRDGISPDEAADQALSKLEIKNKE